jgi:DNA-binding IclR family transcriptional regulator
LIRLLAVLRRGNWVERESDGYRPGRRLAALRAPVSAAERIRAAAQPLLAGLCRASGNTVMLFQCEGETTIGLSKEVHPAAVTMREVGSVTAIDWSSPWCWIQLHGMDAERREEVRAQLRPDQRQWTAARQAWKQLGRSGWCFDDQVGIPLVRRMAAALHHPGDGRLLGVLSLGGNPLTMPDERIDELGTQLIDATETVRQRLA